MDLMRYKIKSKSLRLPQSTLNIGYQWRVINKKVDLNEANNTESKIWPSERVTVVKNLKLTNSSPTSDSRGEKSLQKSEPH